MAKTAKRDTGPVAQASSLGRHGRAKSPPAYGVGVVDQRRGQQGMALLPWSKVDVTFNAFFALTKDVDVALAKTKQQIGGPFPSDYVPPPRRATRASTSAVEGGAPERAISIDPLEGGSSSVPPGSPSTSTSTSTSTDFGTLPNPKAEDPAHPLGGKEGLLGVPFMIPPSIGDIVDPKVPADSRIPGARKWFKRAGAVWDLYDVPQSLYDATLAPLINSSHRADQATRAQFSMVAIESEQLELQEAMGILTQAGVATDEDRQWALDYQQQLEDEHLALQNLLASGKLQGPLKAGWPVIDFVPGGSLLPQIEPGTQTFDEAERQIRLKDIGDCPRCEVRPFKGTVVDHGPR